MNILLVRPQISLQVAQRLKPFLHLEPLSLEIVAGGIPGGHATRILDLNAEKAPEELFARTLAEFKPDVIGFTAFSNQAGAAKQLAAMAKATLGKVLVLIGGPHATMAPEDLQLPDTFDLVIRGEGGTAMRKLIPLLEAGESLPESDVFLPTRSPQFAALAAGMPPELPPYDQVPWPRRDLVKGDSYYCIWHGNPGEKMASLFPPTASVRTSVGCPKRCAFCVVHHLARGKYMRRTPEDVVKELAAIKQDHIYFVDDEMFIDIERAKTMASLLLQRGIKKNYISWARADTIVAHPELFALWKQAGLKLVYVGLESMEPETLKDYNKGTDPDINRKAVAILRDLGIGLHAALMVNPDFSAEDFIKVRKTVYSVTPAEFSFTVFSPPPGTELWKKTRDKFICPDPHAFYDCMHTLLPTKVPLKKFYGYFGLLWLHAIRHNPWRTNRVKVPLKDKFRFFYHGMRYGWSLRNIYKDYPAVKK